MSDLKVKLPLPTSVKPQDGESCQSVIERIAKENEAKYGIASGIYGKTDYDLSENYQSDLWRIYKTIAMACDTLSEMETCFKLKFKLANISVTCQTGFYRWLTERFDECFESNGDVKLDVENARNTLNDTKHNAGVLINQLDKRGKLGTHGKALLIQNVSNLHERLETIVNRVDRFQNHGESVDDVIAATALA